MCLGSIGEAEIERVLIPVWVLDKIGVDTMFANRRAMGRGLIAPRFQLLTYADMLIFPLDKVTCPRTCSTFRVRVLSF